MALRITRTMGIDYVNDLKTHKSLGTAYESGTLLIDNPDNAAGDQLIPSGNNGHYLLRYDVTADGQTVQEYLLGLDPVEVKVSVPCPVFNLKPGVEFGVTTYVSSGTGAISAGNTVAGTLLGIDDSGHLMVRQSGGNPGGRKMAILLESDSTTDEIYVRWEPDTTP